MNFNKGLLSKTWVRVLLGLFVVGAFSAMGVTGMMIAFGVIVYGGYNMYQDNKAGNPASKKYISFLLVGALLMVIAGTGVANKSAHSNSDSESTVAESKETQSVSHDEVQDTTLTSSSSSESVVKEETIEDKVSNLIKQGKAFGPRSYTAGQVPAGEYVFVATKYGASKYYSEDDAAGEIIDNENFSSFGYVQVHATGNLTTRGTLVNVDSLGELGVSGAKELYEKLNDKQNYNGPGMYKIGVDLPAGMHTVSSTGSAYVAVVTGPVGNSDIVDNENFNGDYAVNLADGQYLEMSRAMFKN
ncbi:hypothetical protein [Weissella confusa]|uniref:hypothetical protein n=1 Tax=Weissella confusa TaxID=1583 RepID=UPI0032DB4DBE